MYVNVHPVVRYPPVLRFTLRLVELYLTLDLEGCLVASIEIGVESALTLLLLGAMIRVQCMPRPTFVAKVSNIRL
jgi:hypothetical protein